MKVLNPITIILSLVSFASPIGVAAESSASEVVRLRGEEIKYQGLTLYVSKPHRSLGYKKPGSTTGVLLLTDIYGLKLKENKILADRFAKEGYITVAPDLFKGSPAPSDEPSFNVTEFLAKYPPSVTDPVVAKAIKYIRQELKVKKVAASGYCYGGRYVFRELDKKGGVDVGFTAHPSLLQTDEIQAVAKPVSIAGAAKDDIFPQPRQAETNAILTKIGKPFTSTLYSGTTHGFAVRANASDAQQAFAKDEAFYQAVRFFEAWD
ncbi:dienelactone hydrolase family-domain-containing protein [Fusarium flagelliforme]|uniref:dienelactone hydrolase family-domain-containing protein n=1 Tax=Fusarium flagelliforme TaxID=2675880 RepID=UPI001E8DA6E9|nr:dienelactone hydrolase family-domain-containing protein [Fusarium flagelliforme]KAH7185399.1 dienelactone hydrolase family-domain-containing protein [Fusarium flagelliforme]